MKTIFLKAWFRFEIPDDVPLEDIMLINAHNVKAAVAPPVDSFDGFQIVAEGCRNYETFSVEETAPDDP